MSDSLYVALYTSTSHSLAHGTIQARKPDTTVIAVVRNAKTSTHLAAAIAGLDNVHVVEGDVVDYRSLEVCAPDQRHRYLSDLNYRPPQKLPRRSRAARSTV